MPDTREFFQKVNQEFDSALKKNTGEGFIRLSTALGDAESELRELVQEQTGDKIKKIINKLESGQQINKDDLSLIELWMVGDAHHYSQLENNFQDWTSELKRIQSEINRADGKTFDVLTSMRLRALIYDATRVLADMAYFLQQKERVEKFVDATQEIDNEERDTLIRLLEQKLKSDQY